MLIIPGWIHYHALTYIRNMRTHLPRSVQLRGFYHFCVYFYVMIFYLSSTRTQQTLILTKMNILRRYQIFIKAINNASICVFKFC